MEKCRHGEMDRNGEIEREREYSGETTMESHAASREAHGTVGRGPTSCIRSMFSSWLPAFCTKFSYCLLLCGRGE